MIDLSILVPSLHSRNVFRSRLLAQIAAQPDEYLHRCQILVDIDSRQNSIGAKRNRMIEAAAGQFVVFVDDDDQIFPKYLELIFKGIDAPLRGETQPDAIGIQMLYLNVASGKSKIVKCSKTNEWTFDDDFFYRPIQHTCPIRREIARKVGFPDWNYDEDQYYAYRVSELVEFEYLIDEPIYLYEDRNASRRYQGKDEDVA